MLSESFFKNQTPAMQAMIKARTHLCIEHPFFGALALKLRLVETDAVDTAGVDGVHLFFNPDFVKGLSFVQRRGLIAHEVMHLVLMHHLRRGARNPKKWNHAGDYVLNQILVDCQPPFILPEGALINSKFKDMTTDHVYNMLPDPPDGPGGGGQGSGGEWGIVMDAVDPNDTSKKQDPAQGEQEWKIAIAQAAQSAKAKGNLPGNLAELVEDMVESKVDWREKLRDFVTKVAYDKHNWLHPSRRYQTVEFDEDGVPSAAKDGSIYMPSFRNHTIGKVSVVIDTSGSIGSNELQAFIGEINAIFEDTRPEQIEVIQCDCSINDVTSYTPDTLPINPDTYTVHGRGGTSFKPPFKHYEENGTDERIECLIYLTDMMGDFPDVEPEYSVLWVSTTDIDDAPFGEVVQIDI